jgi:hypothetical protein
MCHPGKRVQCLRGAMGQANLVCQDCHGNMAQVGNDFSKNVSPANPGAFVLAADFYTNATTPRVPWANEPGCGSCHTGDAISSLAGTTGAVTATDGIRLLQTYRTGDANAKPIVPTNKRFAEDVVSFADNPGAAGNPKLYRVSTGGQPITVNRAQVGETGHGGLFCQACHGATHAEWSSSPRTPTANDNQTSNQLQGHAGVIVECNTCHTGTMSNNLNGPHGMHPVSQGWANGGHESSAKNNRDACRACHGRTGQGTALSRTFNARTFTNIEDRGTVTFTKGQQIGCTHCHGNEL